MQEGLHRLSSNLKPRDTEGEMVEVQGSRIVRSTGRKDRHSKINTSKGPRDRRVRLSAHTAIQFYDVQDRLGYDRPSMAVDWLIEKAKAAIDALAELPTQNPTATTVIKSTQEQEQDIEEQSQIDLQHDQGLDNKADALKKRLMEATLDNSVYDFQKMQHLNDNPMNTSSCFSMANATPSSSIHFQNYPPDLNSRTISQTQNLLLSLQSLQDPILLERHTSPIPSVEQALFSAFPLCFNATSTYCSDRQLPEMGQFQRMNTWCSDSTAGNGGEGFVLNSLALLRPQPVLGQNQLFSTRGTLQSSNLPSIHASMNPPVSATDHHQTSALNPLSISRNEFTSDKFLGFPFPARIQGEVKQQGTLSNKPSAASAAAAAAAAAAYHQSFNSSTE